MKRYDVEFSIGNLWLCVEGLQPNSPHWAVLSLRETKTVGGKGNQLERPGPRLLLDPKKRHEVIALAFDLLGVAQKMLPDVAFNNCRGQYARGGDEHPMSKAFSATREQLEKTMKTNVQRWRNLHDRMHILQLAARVLENCSEDVAMTIGSLLFVAERQGMLPITAFLQTNFSDDSHGKTCN
jgi:hypothetical protein